MWYTSWVKPTVPFSEFSKLDLIVGTIKSAKSLKGTDNLLVLGVDLGEGGLRKLIAGLTKTHQVSKLVGKQIVLVANLEAREIKGVRSEGMLLAADVEGKPVLLTPDKEVPSGTKIR